MNVTLPDGSALELPDGASALDAARAIGPKLAAQAVLARVNGEPRDLRLPLPEGATLEILTTRDRDDPDALAVLRHSAAHLLAEAVRRLHPGVKVAIGPPIENGFYYDFEFPEPIHEADLEAIEAEIARELSEGRTLGANGDRRATRRGRGSRRRGSRTRSSSSTPPTATSRSTRRVTSPTSAAGHISRTPRRSRRSS